MNGIQVNIKDVKADNTFEIVRFTMRIISISNNLTLSDTELYALTLFVIEGLNESTKQELIDRKIIKSKYGVANLLSKFRKCGIITKESFIDVINKDYRIPTKDVDGILIKILIKK